MKTTLLAFILLISLSAHSQKLTYGDVYDFEVGDIIQGVYQTMHPVNGGSIPPTYETQTILAKKFSAGNDTIFYAIKKDYYTPRKCDTCKPLIDVRMDTLTVTNLTAEVVHDNRTTCYSVADSFYTDYCSRAVWMKYPVADKQCFEPTVHTTSFVKGLGGPFFDRTDWDGPLRSVYMLQFYKKGNDSCGYFVAGIPEQKELRVDYDLFPNPARNKLNVRAGEKLVSYEIIDMKGAVLITGKLSGNEIDIAALGSGMYALRVYTADLRAGTRNFVKQQGN
jgi:hypothetical protein